MQVKDQNLRAHLLSPEFFDAEQNPEIVFESKKIERDGDQVVVDGELTVKGVTKEVVARGEVIGPAPGPDATTGSGSISRPSSTGMTSASTGRWTCRAEAKILGDDVTLTVHVELVKQEA